VVAASTHSLRLKDSNGMNVTLEVVEKYPDVLFAPTAKGELLQKIS